MAGKRRKANPPSTKMKEAMSIFGTRVEGNYAPVGSHAVGMDGPAKLIIEGTHQGRK